MTTKLKKISKKKRLVIGFLAGIFILSVPLVATLAATDSYDGGIISKWLKDPTKISNGSPYTDGLTDIDGIKVGTYGTWLQIMPEDIGSLNDRIDQDRQQLEDMANALNQLQIAKEEAKRFTTWSNILTADNVAQNSKSVSYNQIRIQMIDKMRANANTKMKWLKMDEDACQVKINSIKLREAEASKDPAKIEAALAEGNTALEKLKESRGELQQLLANSEALADAECWPGGSLTPNIGNCILIGTGWVGNIITWVFALLLWIASKVFDLSVYLSITKIHVWFTMGAVADVWRLCRDLANLCFVFVLLYIALGTVFDLKGMSDPRKMIVNVIVIALLVNFSGFVVRVVVDASNVIAYEFYSKMSGGPTQTIGTELVKKMEISSYFIEAETLTAAKTNADKNFIVPQVKKLSFISIIGQTFGNIIIILVTSFVLLTAAILFLIRTIYLLFIYILSPLAFISYTIPGKSSYFSDWLNKLVKQSFFAPAFLIPLYIVFKLLGENGVKSLISTEAGTLALPMINAIIIGLLIGCIFIANKMGAAGAKFATGVAGGATMLGAKGITKGTRYVGGKVGGAAGRNMSQWARNVTADNARATYVGGARPNLLSRAAANTVLGTKAIGRNTSAGAKYAWNSAPGKAFQKSEAGKKIIGAVKNPLLAASEGIVGLEAAIRSGGGGGSYSFLGKTSAERADAKKKEAEDKKEAKAKEIKDKADRLRTANEVDAGTILGTMTDSDIKELPLDVLARDEISRNLTHSNLDALQKAGNIPNAQRRAMQIAITRAPVTPGYAYMLGPSGAFWG